VKPYANPAARLSAQQQHILRCVYAYEERVRAAGTDDQQAWLAAWGMPLRQRHGPDWTRADSAILSRSLARLEERGLIIRRNAVSERNRTTHILLTEAGREVAKRLTSGDGEHVSRFPVAEWVDGHGQ
jgi:uncharacterized protein YfaT (DUF1175 family)